jgi:aminoglycoside phosphotransferase (APT) family kinase protein/ribosomal protein S18 acetylase RimI-like enzyme
MSEATMTKPEFDREAVTIERAVPDDAEIICDIRDRAWLEAYPNAELGITSEDVRTMAQGREGEFVPRRIAYLKEQFGKDDPNQTTFVAKAAGKVVGFIDPRIDEQNHRRVGAIYVAPEAQGKGVGGKLMKQVLGYYGREQDIYLEVVSYNQNAIDFYKRFGFEQTDTVVPEEEGRPDYLKTLPQIEMVLKTHTTSPETIASEKKLISGLAGTDQITLNDSGWDSRAYNVNNGQYFVKFPRNEKIRGRYGYQIAALKLAAAVDSPIRVSKVVWEDPDNNYFGYEGIEGVPLSEALPTLDEPAKRAVGAALGHFLRQFHELDLPEARPMGLEQEIKQLQDWYQKGLHLSSKVFTEDEQSKLDEMVYNVWPSKLTTLGIAPALCHGDFHFSNIFYGSGGEVGVIDFGDVCNADHSKDFADFEDQAIFEAALAAYGSDDDKLLEKIRLREDMTRIITLTAQLIKNGEQAARETIAKIQESLPE